MLASQSAYIKGNRAARGDCGLGAGRAMLASKMSNSALTESQEERLIECLIELQEESAYRVPSAEPSISATVRGPVLGRSRG